MKFEWVENLKADVKTVLTFERDSFKIEKSNMAKGTMMKEFKQGTIKYIEIKGRRDLLSFEL